MSAVCEASGRWGWITLLVIVVAALVVRVGIGVMRPMSDEAIDALPDQREYLSLARNVLSGEGLSFFDERFGERVWAYRMPGYPVFLAGCGGSVRVVRVVQTVIDTATVLGVYVMARRWLRRGASLAAALLAAFDPFAVFMSSLVLSETLYTAMLVWGMVLLLRRGTWGWLGGGMVLGLSVLVRPSGIVLPAVLVVAAGLLNTARSEAYQQRRASSGVLLRLATVVVLTGALLLPWAIRNKMRIGHWVWTTTNSGITLYDGFNPGATGASDQRFAGSMAEARAPGMNEWGRSQYFSGLAWRWIGEHPGKAVYLAGVKIARTWSPVPLSREYGGSVKYVLVAGVYSVPFFLLVLVGLCRGGLALSAKVFLLIPALYFTGVHACSIGSLRYRIPVQCPMAVIAGWALVWLWSAAKGWRQATK